MSTAGQKSVSGKNDILGTGRRKTSVARVRVRPGTGQITVNSRPFMEYFADDRDREAVQAPLNETQRRNDLDVVVRVQGGGTTGQAGAIKLGIARALKLYDTGLEETLRHSGMLTRDGRMKERKKYGRLGARKGTQFSKR
ncbi:MAG: 30S ribosomal protein S9 [Pirellulales bacterium]